jgi:hypothetical protein
MRWVTYLWATRILARLGGQGPAGGRHVRLVAGVEVAHRARRAVHLELRGPAGEVLPHAALVGAVPPPRADRLAHPGRLPRAEGGVERGVARTELAAAVAPAPLLEDAVLLGADQLLAVQQQERPVGPVRHLEERDASGLAHLGDTGAVAGFLQRQPVGVVEVGGRGAG